MCLTAYLPSVSSNQRPKGFVIEPDSVLFFLERYRPPEDEEKTCGQWAVEAQIDDGKAVSKEELDRRTCIFSQDLFSLNFFTADRKGGGPLANMSYSLDASKQPKAINFFHCEQVEAGNKYEPFPGIYKLDKDRLTIAYRKGGPRPEKFESQPGSGVTLLVLRRTEPPKWQPGMGMGGYGGMGMGGMGIGGMGMGGMGTQPPQPKEPPLRFGPVIERVVNAIDKSKGGQGLDLAGGKLVDLPEEFAGWSAEQQGKWAADNNVDLLVDFFAASDLSIAGEYLAWMPKELKLAPPAVQRKKPEPILLALMPEGLKLAALRDPQWEEATDADLRSALASPRPGVPLGADERDVVAHVRERHGITLYVPATEPATFAFQTRKGDMGILQVIRLTEEPRGVRLRYKLVQPSGSASATTAAAAPKETPPPVVTVARPIVREISDYEEFPGRIETSPWTGGRLPAVSCRKNTASSARARPTAEACAAIKASSG